MRQQQPKIKFKNILQYRYNRSRVACFNFFFLIEVSLVYNVAGVPQSDPVIYVYSFSESSPSEIITKH